MAVLRKSNRLFEANRRRRVNKYKFGDQLKQSGSWNKFIDQKDLGDPINMASTAVGQATNALISHGLESGAGKAVTTIGQGVGNIVSKVNPVAGAIVNVGSGIIGGGVNALFGSKLNEENIAEVEDAIKDTNARSVMDASSYDDLAAKSMENGVFNFDKSYIGKDGVFSSKAQDEYDRLQFQAGLANDRQQLAISENAQQIADEARDSYLRNMIALGGSLNKKKKRYASGGPLGDIPGPLGDIPGPLGDVSGPLGDVAGPLPDFKGALKLNKNKSINLVNGPLGLETYAKGGNLFWNFDEEDISNIYKSLKALWGRGKEWVHRQLADYITRDKNNRAHEIMSNAQTVADLARLYTGTQKQFEQRYGPQFYAARDAFLMDEDAREKYLTDDMKFVKTGVPTNDEEAKKMYGVVDSMARAISTERGGYIPVYQISGDAFPRDGLVPLGNWGYNGPVRPSHSNGLLGNEQPHTIIDFNKATGTIYADPHTGDMYQKVWDINDYEGKALLFNTEADLIKKTGSPFVITTGILPINITDNGEERPMNISEINNWSLPGVDKGKLLEKYNELQKKSKYSLGGSLYPGIVKNHINITEMNRGIEPYAFGGELNTQGANFTNGLLEINNGSTHEANPLQGVPMGTDMEGTPNVVEEGETIYDDYVYSNRIKIPDMLKKKYKLGGKKKSMTFAEASKKLARESKERPNDPISSLGLEAMMAELRENQDVVKQAREMGRRQAEQDFMHSMGLPTAEEVGMAQQQSDAMAMQEHAAMEQQAMAQQQPMMQEVPMGIPEQAAMQGYALGGRVNGFDTFSDLKLPKIQLGNWGRGFYTLSPYYVEPGKYFIPDPNDVGKTHYIDAANVSLDQLPKDQSFDVTRDVRYYPADTKSNMLGYHNIKMGAQDWVPDWMGKGNVSFSYNGYTGGENTEGQKSQAATYAATTPKTTATTASTAAQAPATTENGLEQYYKAHPLERMRIDMKQLAKKPPVITDPLTGKPVTVTASQTADDTTTADLQKPRSEWARRFPLYASGAQVLTDALGITNKPDYTEANMIQRASDANYLPVRAGTLGNRLRFRPFDRNWAMNEQRAANAATMGAIRGNAGLNRGIASNALIANNAAYTKGIGDIAKTAAEYNDRLRTDVATFNRNTDQYNIQNAMSAAQSNQGAYAQARQRYLSGIMSAANQHQLERQAIDEAKAQNLTNFINSMGEYGRDNMNFNRTLFALDTGSFGPVRPEQLQFLGLKPKKECGKLKRRKR